MLLQACQPEPCGPVLRAALWLKSKARHSAAAVLGCARMAAAPCKRAVRAWNVHTQAVVENIAEPAKPLLGEQACYWLSVACHATLFRLPKAA